MAFKKKPKPPPAAQGDGYVAQRRAAEAYNGNVNVRGISENTCHAFKVWCTKNKITMSKAIEKLMAWAARREIVFDALPGDSKET